VEGGGHDSFNAGGNRSANYFSGGGFFHGNLAAMVIGAMWDRGNQVPGEGPRRPRMVLCWGERRLGNTGLEGRGNSLQVGHTI